MRSTPAVLFVVDLKRESIAVAEARRLKIPVVSLSSSDCNLKDVEYPIPGNDASMKSIEYFVNQMVSAIEEGKKSAAIASAVKAEKKPE